MSTNASPPPPAVSRQRLRWLVPPVVATALVAAFGLGPSLIGGSAGAAPILPDISAQDLVAKVVAADPPAFSGTVQTRTNLGLPSLGPLSSASSTLLSTLLSPHTLKVSAAPGGKFHVAIPDGLAETDLVSDGTQLWVWQSGSQTVTHLAKSAGGATAGHDFAHDPVGGVEPTPDALAQKLLAEADPTTRVFVRGTASVAGRDAYELVLSPKSADTLVADVVIDVDATNSLPLRVQVLGKNAGTPALDMAFTSLTLGAPPDSAFTFTPPSGARVIEVTSPQELLVGPRGRQEAPVSPQGGSGPVRRKVGPPNGKVPPVVAPPSTPADTHLQVLGTAWDTVLALPGDGPMAGPLGIQVSGPWGSGRLVTSPLVDALVLDNGTLLVGMVGPDRLEAAVGELHS